MTTNLSQAFTDMVSQQYIATSSRTVVQIISTQQHLLIAIICTVLIIEKNPHLTTLFFYHENLIMHMENLVMKICLIEYFLTVWRMSCHMISTLLSTVAYCCCFHMDNFGHQQMFWMYCLHCVSFGHSSSLPQDHTVNAGNENKKTMNTSLAAQDTSN